MYIKFKNITIWEVERWDKKFPNLQLNLCWLYKDDDKYIKRIEMTERIKDKLEETKIEITIPEIEYALKDHDIEKIVSKDDSLLDNTKDETRLF